jgi:three-Cys-motif partner protein
MTPAKRSKIRQVKASDGLRARDNGEWGEQKLDFITTFGPPALRATQAKRSRHYIDLFAGPGINRVRDHSREFDGSPLRAIELTGEGSPPVSFTDAVFVNRDRRDHSALQARIASRVSEGRSRLGLDRIACHRGDANVCVSAIMRTVHPRAYAFVFADMEAPRQFPWTSVEALTSQGHQSVDLYMLFPLDMALKRLISRNPTTVAQSAKVLTAFFGTEDWRPLLRHREGRGSELGRELQALYVSRLREIWKHADEVCDVRRGSSHRLYKMLYASNSDVGKRIARWAAKRNAPPSLFD